MMTSLSFFSSCLSVIRRIVLLIAVLCCSASVFSQFTWSQQNSTTTNNIKDLFFISVNEGWAVGINGTIIHTSNGGVTWASQVSGCSANLHEVFFININVGWAVGDAGTVLRTDDGGDTWITAASGVTTSLEGVAFYNGLIGWACGYDGTYGKFFKTTDGGYNWTEHVVNPTTSGLWKMDFVNDTVGWVVGVSGIYKTENGGADWTFQPEPSGQMLEAICMIDAQEGWVVGKNGTIVHTIDGGANWQIQPTGTGAWMWDIEFITADHGVAVGESGAAYYTLNGGDNWFASTDFLVSANNFSTVELTSYYTAYLAGEYGVIFKAPAGNNDLELDFYHGLDTVCANVKTPVVVNIKNNGPAMIEEADFVILQGVTPILTYHWTGVMASGDFEDIYLGDVQVTTSDTYYCAISGDSVTTNNLSSKFINVIAAPAEAGGPYTICPGDSVEIGAYGGNSYFWFNATVDSANAFQFVSPLSSQYYHVLIETDFCTFVDSASVFVETCTEAITAISPNDDGVNDFLHIEGISAANNTVNIYNRWGDLIRTFENYDNETISWDGTYKNGQEVEPGVYYYSYQAPSLGIEEVSWLQVVR